MLPMTPVIYAPNNTPRGLHALKSRIGREAMGPEKKTETRNSFERREKLIRAK